MWLTFRANFSLIFPRENASRLCDKLSRDPSSTLRQGCKKRRKIRYSWSSIAWEWTGCEQSVYRMSSRRVTKHRARFRNYLDNIIMVWQFYGVARETQTKPDTGLKLEEGVHRKMLDGYCNYGSCDEERSIVLCEENASNYRVARLLQLCVLQFGKS